MTIAVGYVRSILIIWSSAWDKLDQHFITDHQTVGFTIFNLPLNKFD